MWFSQLLQENDDTALQNILTQDRIFKCYKKSDLEEIHIKLHNQ